MELTTTLAGITLEHPLMNAAGTCKIVENVLELTNSTVAAVMVGSGTIESRPGNTGDVYWAGSRYSLNSLGLPNPGIAYYEKHLLSLAYQVHNAGKKLFFSAAGFTPREYAELTEMAFSGDADLVELNLGCPNLWEGHQQKRIACFDPGLVQQILNIVEVRIGHDAHIAVKISPFSDPYALGEVAAVLSASPLVKVVTSTNTFPNAFKFAAPGKPQITPGGGLAGMAGPALKPIGLGQVRQLRALLPERIQIIGVGGITHGMDIKEYLDSGATAVQVGTAYLERHRPVFERLLNEYLEVAE